MIPRAPYSMACILHYLSLMEDRPLMMQERVGREVELESALKALLHVVELVWHPEGVDERELREATCRAENVLYQVKRYANLRDC